MTRVIPQGPRVFSSKTSHPCIQREGRGADFTCFSIQIETLTHVKEKAQFPFVVGSEREDVMPVTRRLVVRDGRVPAAVVNDLCYNDTGMKDGDMR